MKLKKITAVALCMLIGFILCSCSSAQTTDSTTTTKAVTSIAEQEEGTTNNAPTNAPTSVSKQESTTLKAEASKTVTKSNSSTTNTTKKVKATEKKAKSTTTEKRSDGKPEAVAEKCTLTIECKSILDNMDSLKTGHEVYVSNDGYIIKEYSCKYYPHMTAYDLLKEACDQSNIRLTTSSTIYGKYVSGINNLDEFDCGGESGWLYMVNGKKYPLSCDKYELSPNDEVVFTYTCKY